VATTADAYEITAGRRGASCWRPTSSRNPNGNLLASVPDKLLRAKTSFWDLVPNHGSRTSSSPERGAGSSAIALVPAGLSQPLRGPQDEVLDALRALGARLSAPISTVPLIEGAGEGFGSSAIAALYRLLLARGVDKTRIWGG